MRRASGQEVLPVPAAGSARRLSAEQDFRGLSVACARCKWPREFTGPGYLECSRFSQVERGKIHERTDYKGGKTTGNLPEISVWIREKFLKIQES